MNEGPHIGVIVDEQNSTGGFNCRGRALLRRRRIGAHSRILGCLVGEDWLFGSASALGGNPQRERGSDPDFALNGEVSPVKSRQLSGEGEPDTCAARRSGSGAVDLVKALEDLFVVAGVNPNPGVTDADDPLIAALLEVD